MHPRNLRLLRGWSAAFAATAVAASAHVLAGGAIRTPGILLLSLALSGLLSCALSGRTLPLVRLSAAVIASQGVFHLLFGVGGAGSYEPGVPMPAAASGHAHHAASAAAAAADTASAEAAGTGAGLVMAGAHLAAALITIVLIRHGETSVRRLAEAVRLRITAFLPLFSQPTVRYLRVAALTDFLAPLHRLGVPLQVMRHRGPPLPA